MIHNTLAAPEANGLRARSETADSARWRRAWRARDACDDGRFFVGVRTTRIYCRPICPGKQANWSNVSLYRSAAAARVAGLRPCLRCRPELAPSFPEWSDRRGIVTRALRILARGAPSATDASALASDLGIDEDRLHQAFLFNLDATPSAVMETRRFNLAKILIAGTHFDLQSIAATSGYYDQHQLKIDFENSFGRPPEEFRHQVRQGSTRGSTWHSLRLDFRPHFSWKHLLQFLAARTTPGVEEVVGAVYRRSFRLGDEVGVLKVRPHQRHNALELCVSGEVGPDTLLQTFVRVRRLFDLDADAAALQASLSGDTALRPWLRRLPGVRVPGTWDAFELACRAIIGQQISVKGATTIAGRIAQRFGEPLPHHDGGLWRLFPTPERIANADLDGLGMPRARARALRLLARAVLNGNISFSTSRNERLKEALIAIPGIGPWTVQYIALRLGEPDAFPATDLALLKSPASRGTTTPQALLERAETWRPWRAYAAMILWQALAVSS